MSNNSINIFEPWKWLSKRNSGLLRVAEWKRIYQSLYVNMSPVFTWDPHGSSNGGHHGAIFNFDYSIDGSILIAACQNRSFLMFDPFNGKLIDEKLEAHTDCVNCVRFLDNRLFATCSDDRTVVLWDCRFLRTKVKTLCGHTYWVKNIEYDSSQSLLVTSGFDGKICTWDINNYSDKIDEHKQVFTAKGLMRSKLTPDSTKLIISTTHGYMIIIHDLNLQKLATDLQNFKPDVYRVIRTNAAGKSELVKDNPYFHRKRNRVEFISDFPSGNEAEVVASLQVHPHGWCIVSRNTSFDSDSEWVCVHDIQSTNYNEDVGPTKNTENQNFNSDPVNYTREGNFNACQKVDATYNGNTSDSSEVLSDWDYTDDNLAEALSSISEHSGLSHAIVSKSTNEIDSSSSSSGLCQTRGDKTSTEVEKDSYEHSAFKMTKPRLMFYKREPNVLEGLIKELCLSHDGRVICSPYKDGVRLLTFSEHCDEICDCVPSEIKQLQVYQCRQSHKSYVLATKFSPTHYMFVSGSLSGEVVFHQPVL